MNIDDLSTRRKQLCLDLAVKSTKHEKLKNMFPKFKKSHKMQTRKPLNFFVQYANTDRLKNSAIPYMQRLINEQDIKF